MMSSGLMHSVTLRLILLPIFSMSLATTTNVSLSNMRPISYGNLGMTSKMSLISVFMMLILMTHLNPSSMMPMIM